MGVWVYPCLVPVISDISFSKNSYWTTLVWHQTCLFWSTARPGWIPISKGHGCLWEILLNRTAKRYKDPVLWVWLKIFFHPLRCTISKTTHYMTSTIFCFCTRKGTTTNQNTFALHHKLQVTITVSQNNKAKLVG